MKSHKNNINKNENYNFVFTTQRQTNGLCGHPAEYRRQTTATENYEDSQSEEFVCRGVLQEWSDYHYCYALVRPWPQMTLRCIGVTGPAGLKQSDIQQLCYAGLQQP